MLKDTKSLGNSKASACESRGFVHKKKKVRFLTHLLACCIYLLIVCQLVIILFYFFILAVPAFLLSADCWGG